MSSSKIYSPRSNGRQHGDVFTKPEVVSFMLDEVNYVASRNLSQVTIMEPSCGEGAILLAIVQRLAESSAAFGFDLNEAFHHCVFASDIDTEKTDICIRQIHAAFPEIVHPEKNIVAEDYLLSTHSSVDIVVGNPPYIRYEEIPEDKLADYRAFPTFFYRADIYVPFFEKSLSELNPGGTHCFICANRWMRNQYGKKLRQLIAQYYSIEKIVNLEGADAFQEQVLAYPAITVIRNTMHKGSLKYMEVRQVSKLTAPEYQSLPSPKGDDWTRVFTQEHQDLSLIEEQNFKIGIGVATGADAVFISSALKGRVEDSLLLPAVNARDLCGNRMNWGEKYLLNPYDSAGKLILLDHYPLAKAYLEAHKAHLASRHMAKKYPARWYGTIDAVTPMLKREPKILLPDISANSYVFVDEGNYYPLHNIYYIKGNGIRQLRLLAAILMSDFVREQLNSLTNRMNGGYARWQSQYLRKLRIPTISRIAEATATALLRCYDERDLDGINFHVKKILAKEKNTQTNNRGNGQVTQLILTF